MRHPELSVVVASHDRPLRLRWLLNALDAQTLDRSCWEVVVGHDSAGPETEQLLASHPLAFGGVLRSTRLAPGTGPPGANRNAALALARAPTIVFTDDDCRPPEDWLENVAHAVRRHPGAIVQGPVEADPDEWPMLRSPYPRTQAFSDVPRLWAECCNIVYPKELLDRIGGFVEDVYTGEDADLNARARAAGARYVGEPRMLTYHAVEEGLLFDWVRGVWRWRDLPLLFKRQPQLRSAITARVFWKSAHMWLPVAGIGLGMAKRNAVYGVLALPWTTRRPKRGRDVRSRLRDLMELPGWAVIDAVETGVLALGSIRNRTVLL